MDFTKFVAMLVDKGLYLSRLDRLGDSYEGWIPETPKRHYGPFLSQEYMERDRELREQSKKLKRDFYVNCWHANDKEWDAMRKL